jgi:hypothetical protein
MIRRKGHGASNQLFFFFLRYTINDEDKVYFGIIFQIIIFKT